MTEINYAVPKLLVDTALTELHQLGALVQPRSDAPKTLTILRNAPQPISPKAWNGAVAQFSVQQMEAHAVLETEPCELVASIPGSSFRIQHELPSKEKFVIRGLSTSSSPDTAALPFAVKDRPSHIEVLPNDRFALLPHALQLACRTPSRAPAGKQNKTAIGRPTSRFISSRKIVVHCCETQTEFMERTWHE